jgi:hypothetical protein
MLRISCSHTETVCFPKGKTKKKFLPVYKFKKYSKLRIIGKQKRIHQPEENQTIFFFLHKHHYYKTAKLCRYADMSLLMYYLYRLLGKSDIFFVIINICFQEITDTISSRMLVSALLVTSIRCFNIKKMGVGYGDITLDTIIDTIECFTLLLVFSTLMHLINLNNKIININNT